MENSTYESGIPTEAGTALPPSPTSASLERRKPDPLKRQQALLAMGRRAVAPPEGSILAQDAAALLAETLDTEYSAVAELSPDGKSLQLRLTLGETDTTEPRTRVHQTSAAGIDSLAGYVLQVAHPITVADLARDKRFHDAFLRKQGIKSAVAVPLKLQDRSFGSLAACSNEDRHFDAEDVTFAEMIAHLVATTIARKQAEKSLADERRFASGVLQTVDALVLLLDAQCQIIRVNPACERVTGFSLAEIAGRAIWDVFLVPEEVETFQRLLGKLCKGKSPIEHEGYLLTKHSDLRLILWSFNAMSGDDGTPEAIIAAGVDITEQREAEAKTARAERAAAEARRAVMKLTGTGGGEQGETTSASSLGQAQAAEEEAVEAFGRLPIPINAERRGRPRRSYPYKQRIAPMVAGKLPDRNEFSEILCNDIAAGGFSYLSPKPPVSDTLVVALGVPPKVTYLIAQIAHVTRVEEDGQRMFTIGCNYVGRAAY